MNRVLNDFMMTVMVYLDDIMIYSKTKADHEVHVRKVLQHRVGISWLSSIWSGNLTLRKQGQGDSEWPVPTNVQEVRQFVGLGSHYRRFIQDFAAMASPLTDLTKGTGTKKEQLFGLKSANALLTRSKPPHFSKPILSPQIRTSHTSSRRMLVIMVWGAVLLQRTRWRKASDCVRIKKLSDEERSYRTRKEMLAILHALRAWRCFIEGRPYTVFSDHNPLKYFRTQVKPTPRLTRWMAEIELYDPTIVTWQRKTVPDLLSRRDGPILSPMNQVCVTISLCCQVGAKVGLAQILCNAGRQMAHNMGSSPPAQGQIRGA
ncbi:hypothetical protein O0I10_012246 [Lichtheimia ornata]|uniref:Reverse transcriptase RNase H-like domain-containing protein n=1 Tax=Lichtheimia ornata TaxID=688661 RepID=A0AAD7US29_9FUNG|nr:uncharacterized protein O0I10_012246 [Lichtheimia ornata]KAJ8652138.1 hypothetical protein O0I10_012246 [Lichtheimia ornata]